MPILNGSSQKVPDSPDLSSGLSSFIIEKSPVCQGKRGSEVKITKEQVLHVARLSSLSLDSGEEERVALELSRILDYVEGLASVQLPPPGIIAKEETDGLTVMAGDIPASSLPPSTVFLNAPDSHGGFFRVPRIVEEGR